MIGPHENYYTVRDHHFRAPEDQYIVCAGCKLEFHDRDSFFYDNDWYCSEACAMYYRAARCECCGTDYLTTITRTQCDYGMCDDCAYACYHCGQRWETYCLNTETWPDGTTSLRPTCRRCEEEKDEVAA